MHPKFTTGYSRRGNTNILYMYVQRSKNYTKDKKYKKVCIKLQLQINYKIFYRRI